MAASCGVSREDTLAEPDGVSAVDATEQTESTDAGDGASQQDDPAPTPSTTQLIAPATTAPAADVAATVEFDDGTSTELLHGALNDIVVPTSENLEFVDLVYSGVVPPGFNAVVLSQTVLGEVMDNELAKLETEASDADREEAKLLLFGQLEQLLATTSVDPAAEAERLFDEVPYLPFIANLQARQIALSAALAAASTESPIEDPCVRHILVEEEETANEVLGLLNDGGDFATLAGEYSTGPTGPNGGDLGCGPADAYVPEFATAVTEAEIGAFIGPVETQFGFHVILVERFEPREANGDQLAQDQLNNGLIATTVTVDERVGIWDTTQFTIIPADQ